MIRGGDVCKYRHAYPRHRQRVMEFVQNDNRAEVLMDVNVQRHGKCAKAWRIFPWLCILLLNQLVDW